MAQMTIPEAEQWIKRTDVKLTKWGWMPVHKKLAKYIRQRTTSNFRGHKTPDGSQWKKAEYWVPKRKLNIGNKAVIGLDNRAGSANYGKPYKRKIRTEDELKSAKRAQWWPEMLLASHKKKLVNPIYRRKGIPELRIKQAYRLYQQFNSAGRQGGNGGVVQMGKFHFRFGLFGWSEKLAGLHWGGTKYKHQPINARPLLGLNQKDVKFVVDTYSAHYMKRIEKANSD